MAGDQMRMSDAEREQAAAELGEHFAQGRLSAEEHAERLDRIWSARTRGELGPVFRDLPRLTAPGSAPLGAGPWPGGGAYPDRGTSSGASPAPWQRGLPGPLFLVLAVLLVATVVTHLPLILLGVGAWLFLAHRHRNRHGVRRW